MRLPVKTNVPVEGTQFPPIHPGVIRKIAVQSDRQTAVTHLSLHGETKTTASKTQSRAVSAIYFCIPRLDKDFKNRLERFAYKSEFWVIQFLNFVRFSSSCGLRLLGV